MNALCLTEREYTAVHEAGHAVMAAILRIPIICIEPKACTVTGAESALDDALFACGGGAATGLVYGDRMGCEHDDAHLEGLVPMFHDLGAEDFHLLATEMMRENLAAVHSVADALVECPHMDRLQFERLVAPVVRRVPR